ncbi:hypothetical protein Pflav_010860 [Phytohabitans flavus]|uniref:Zinc-finger domain-containing protein n=1 Tax=Phytohabitans flavus TaxID=1076124 RepID=A0A6F8XLI7_9ACTN|nr:hypothetical protein [Phytohabitans flavus]BCB74676.1 hypothetical protein Pflav_010860 [Phytohabitans flavus]
MNVIEPEEVSHVDYALLLDDTGLDPAEENRSREHLTGCAPCREELAESLSVVRALRELPPEILLDGPPEDGELLRQRVLRRVRTEATGMHGRQRMARVAGVAAALVALTSAGAIVGQAAGDGPREAALPPASTAPTGSGARKARRSGPPGSWLP